MKKITLVLLLLLAFDFGFGQTSDLIISEYGEGSSFNKYIEIFNGTGTDVDLADYELWRVVNGGTWPENTFGLSGTLANGSVYIIAHPSSDPTILAAANIISGSAIWTGDDATGLAKDDGTGTFFLIDVIGTDGADPGTGWDVAGTTNATANHTLVRKNSICDPNTNWSTSAGTTVTNSEWVVLVIDDWSDIGTHTTSCCISTTIYTGTWSSGLPDSLTKSVVISSNYSTTTGDIVGCSLTVDAGATLTIANGTFAEIENDVTINGTLVVETQGNFVQRDNAGTFTNNGTSSVNKTTATKADWYYYTYWSSPVVGETTTNVFPDVDGDRRFWFNAANFVDTDADNVDDNADAWQYALASNGTENMLPGVGYAVTEARLFSNFAPGTGSASFQGEFNTGDIDTNISFNATNPGTSWNFIGNPYPSAIDFDAFYAANSGVIDGTAYFWSQATPPSGANPGNEQSNFSRNDYAMYAAGSGGIGIEGASGVIPSQYIPSGQGFFIAGLANGPATFTNVMRMADATSNTQFFKNSSAKQNTATANRLWLNLTSDNGIFNQILVAYVDGATNGIDNGAYDAKRFLTPDFNTTLYSTIEGSNTKFAIQGKAINSLTEDEIINLGFATNIDVATLYTFSIAQLEGDFLANNTIYLKDNVLNKVHNLSDSDYSFTSEVGEFNDRFEILFKADTTLSIDNNPLDANTLKIVELDDDHVQFTASKNIAAVRIFDLLGRQLYQFKGNTTSETYNLSQLSSGSIYIAKAELSSGAIITKKAFKK